MLRRTGTSGVSRGRRSWRPWWIVTKSANSSLHLLQGNDTLAPSNNRDEVYHNKHISTGAWSLRYLIEAQKYYDIF
jgi:hypothetical protein